MDPWLRIRYSEEGSFRVCRGVVEIFDGEVESSHIAPKPLEVTGPWVFS